MEIPRPKILVVDDDKANLISMQRTLETLDVDIVCVESGDEALAQAIEGERFALCLLDIMMPFMDGYETAELLRRTHSTQYLPIIFITAINKDEKHVFKGYKSGGVDYIFKPVIPEILLAKINVFLDLYAKHIEYEQKSRELELRNLSIQQFLLRDLMEPFESMRTDISSLLAHNINQLPIDVVEQFKDFEQAAVDLNDIGFGNQDDATLPVP